MHGTLDERAVDASMRAALGPRSAKWDGVWVWFGGVFVMEG